MPEPSNTDQTSRLPPHNLAAEESALGAVLLANESIDDVAGFLRAEHFHSHACALVYRVALDLHRQGRPADPVTVADELERLGQLAEVGGPAFIGHLTDVVPHSWHAAHYARIVFTDWQLRQLIYSTTDALKEAFDRADSAEVIAARAEKRLHGIMESTVSRRSVGVGDALRRMFDELGQGKRQGPLSGWRPLDEKLAFGFPRGGLSIVAGRPGCGKTSLLGGIVCHLAGNGVPSLFVSLEQPAVEICERWLAAEADLPAGAIRLHDSVDDVTRERIMVASTRLSELPIQIADDPAWTVGQIATMARLDQRRRGLGVIAVDYLQLVKPEDTRVVREQQIAGITRGLKILARELDIVVIVGAQLNRGVEQRKGKDDRKPRLSDLRESGAIEQDSDVVLLLHRPSVSDPEADPREAQVIVAKHRGGPTGTVRLDWEGDRMAFREPGPDFDEPYFQEVRHP